MLEYSDFTSGFVCAGDVAYGLSTLPKRIRDCEFLVLLLLLFQKKLQLRESVLNTDDRRFQNHHLSQVVGYESID